MRFDDAVLALAAEQHALVATWQLRASGLTTHDIDDLRSSWHWDVRSSRVLARSGAPATEDQRLMAAVLDASPGAAISGSTAAAMWGVAGFRTDPVHVVRHKGISRRPSTLATVHEVVDLHPAHLKVVRGITVVSPARVVCELTAMHPGRAERALDHLWANRLLDGRTFRRTVEELAGRGRRGSPLMRELDEARGPAYVPPASGLEHRFQEITPQTWRRQVDLGDDEWCGRVDYLHPVLPLVAEIQSERYHAALVDRAADARRRARLEAAGLEVVEVWDTDVFHRPQHVRDVIATAERRLRGAAAA
jgi:very-short-patch-repair endonuclease